MKAWGFTYKTNLISFKNRKDRGPDGRGVGFYSKRDRDDPLRRPQTATNARPAGDRSTCSRAEARTSGSPNSSTRSSRLLTGPVPGDVHGTPAEMAPMGRRALARRSAYFFRSYFPRPTRTKRAWPFSPKCCCMADLTSGEHQASARAWGWHDLLDELLATTLFAQEVADVSDDCAGARHNFGRVSE